MHATDEGRRPERHVTILDRYRPHESWFAHAPNGIHGIGHVTRVLVWADRLAAVLLAKGASVDADVVRWAAIIHDVGRLNDGRDPEHGDRSARWLLDNARRLPAELTEEQLACIRYCCFWHVPPDRVAPELTSELVCLKDADGLDRVRIADLDVRHLRTAEARALQADARRLFEAMQSRGDTDPWEAGRQAAARMGLWR